MKLLALLIKYVIASAVICLFLATIGAYPFYIIYKITKPKIFICISLLLLLGVNYTTVSAQKIAAKTNLLYGAYTYTPNLGLEISLNKRSTLDIGGGYNPWNLKGTSESNQKLVHWLGQAEYRYWLCQKFSGHFFGAHALGSQFNISQHELPLIFGKGSKDYRYEGYGYGGGISYGYQFILGTRWNLELNMGIGYAKLHYNQYSCIICGEKLANKTKNYFGPTKAAISLLYIIK